MLELPKSKEHTITARFYLYVAIVLLVCLLDTHTLLEQSPSMQGMKYMKCFDIDLYKFDLTNCSDQNVLQYVIILMSDHYWNKFIIHIRLASCQASFIPYLTS